MSKRNERILWIVIGLLFIMFLISTGIERVIAGQYTAVFPFIMALLYSYWPLYQAYMIGKESK